MKPYDQTSPGTQDGGRLFVTLVLLGAGALMLAAGVWCVASPRSFATFAGFPYSKHFIHDAGAFQIGIGTTLLLAAVWADAAAAALAGFLAGNTVHAVNHVADLNAGGHAADGWALGVVSLLVLVALVRRLRRLGYVVGEVADTASAALARFARQKTAVLTTYKRDGTPVLTPLSVAVDGPHAYVRSYEKAWKVRRIRNNPEVELAPCTALGRPTGPAARMRARRLQGAEARHAARLLARKYPLLQRVVVPSAHRLLRAKTGRTVHMELSPLDRPLEEPGLSGPVRQAAR
ncbi:MAG: PPOX class F420-dependent oxidoreductase [Micromonosporaceae bacterium]